MKLYLVRHGESVSSDIDPDQPLSETGKSETEVVAKHLKPLNIEIDEIIHSVKQRAKQTAEILKKSIAPNLKPTQREGLKPMDPIEPIVEELQSSDRNVMIVGHLPFMEKLLSHLLFKEEKSGIVDFCGSVVVCLEGKDREWRIAWVVSPKLAHPSLAQ